VTDFPLPPAWATDALRAGMVIPAHPLALTADRKLDERRQRALTRYYHAAGASGLAVAVHTTQFEIRDPRHGLLRPVLELVAETVATCDQATGRRTMLVAGVCGPTMQAIAEARLARDLGYHAGLLSVAAFRDADEQTLLEHCRAVAREIPLFGFYLQPVVGGRVLPVSFWRRFVEIPNVVAIKVAPFDRYRTLEVVRAVAEVGRENEVALYTGNDDAIVADLVTEFAVPVGGTVKRLRFAGGLLGHWACWTRAAVGLWEDCRAAMRAGSVPAELLTRGAEVTDCNAALFDAANGFAGCIAGIHEVLRRQGLLANTLCLNPDEGLSPGQAAEIDRVARAYPHLTDDDFVAAHLSEWLA